MKKFKFFGKSKESDQKLLELSDSKLESVVGGVSFRASIATACGRCKYKYSADAAAL